MSLNSLRYDRHPMISAFRLRHRPPGLEKLLAAI
jgi:hypothetical protein